jgi:hypothetical protein
VNFVRESRCFLRPILADFFEIFFGGYYCEEDFFFFPRWTCQSFVFSSKEEEKILMLSFVVSMKLSNMLQAWSDFR